MRSIVVVVFARVLRSAVSRNSPVTSVARKARENLSSNLELLFSFSFSVFFSDAIVRRWPKKAGRTTMETRLLLLLLAMEEIMVHSPALMVTQIGRTETGNVRCSVVCLFVFLLFFCVLLIEV